MAVTSGFFDGDTYYGQEEFNRYFNYLFESGVGVDDNGDKTFAFSAQSYTVTLGAGFAIVKGFFCYNDADIDYTLTPDSNYNYYCRLVVRANLVSGPVEIALKTGTPSSSPVAPALTQNSSVWEIPLVKILVNKSGSLVNLIALDERTEIRPKNYANIEEEISAIQTEWSEWFSARQEESMRPIYYGSTTPTDPPVGSLWFDTGS